MAVSKNNRRKKRRRTQNHSAPVDMAKRQEELRASEEQQALEKRHLRLSVIAVVIMVAGLMIAWKAGHVIGYPITFVGSLVGLYAARKQGKKQRVTVICYTIYSALIAYMWIAEFMAS